MSTRQKRAIAKKLEPARPVLHEFQDRYRQWWRVEQWSEEVGPQLYWNNGGGDWRHAGFSIAATEIARLAATVKALREENAKLRLQNTDLCHQLLASPSVHAVSAEEEP